MEKDQSFSLPKTILAFSVRNGEVSGKMRQTQRFMMIRFCQVALGIQSESFPLNTPCQTDLFLHFSSLLPCQQSNIQSKKNYFKKF